MKLLKQIEDLKKSEIKNVVDSKVKEFKETGKGGEDIIFKELCFCLMTANFQAEKSIKIQEEIGDGFLNHSEKRLAKDLKRLGHRFPNVRAKFIFESRKKKNDIVLDRDWLVNNIKGFGYKEASHFLRNVGSDDHAIIDFHIVDILVKNNLIEKPKTLTKKNYLLVEDVVKLLGKKVGLGMAELDLYLWYLETGKILK